jgi:Fe-S-cluster-containing hydrogenase component 2
MGIKIEPLRCTGCRICEFACGYHHDQEFSAIGSSIMLYREEGKNYFGIIVKRERDLLLGRPEGASTLDPSASGGSESASAKPILMRPTCDECEGLDTPLCVIACPVQCLSFESP